MGKKDEEIKRLEGKVSELTDANKKLREKIQTKSLLGVGVDISGVESDKITETLNQATKVVIDRLKELKRENEFDVLAHPHTMDISLIR